MGKFKHSPEVRAYLAKVKREYRAKKKAEEAEAEKQTTSSTCKTPAKGALHNGIKQPKP